MFENLFYYLQYTIYILYIIIFLGLWNKAPEYLSYLDHYMKIIVGITLLYAFEPFSKQKLLTQFHKDVAFSAGFFIIMSTSISGYINNITNKVKDII